MTINPSTDRGPHAADQSDNLISNVREGRRVCSLMFGAQSTATNNNNNNNKKKKKKKKKEKKKKKKKKKEKKKRRRRRKKKKQKKKKFSDARKRNGKRTLLTIRN